MNPAAPSEPSRSSQESCPFTIRAMTLWPRLDRRALWRCGCDAHRIAAYVSRRTSLPVEVIAAMLEEGDRSEPGPSFFFG
jgi:hypothetical protein